MTEWEDQDATAAQQANGVIMGHAVALKKFELAESRYEIEITDQFGNTVKMKGTLRADAADVRPLGQQEIDEILRGGTSGA